MLLPLNYIHYICVCMYIHMYVKKSYIFFLYSHELDLHHRLVTTTTNWKSAISWESQYLILTANVHVRIYTHTHTQIIIIMHKNRRKDGNMKKENNVIIKYGGKIVFCTKNWTFRASKLVFLRFSFMKEY